MPTETLVSVRDVIAAIRGAFRGAGPCHCHTVAKLGEDEILERLVRQRLIPQEELVGVNGLTIQDVRIGRQNLSNYLPWALSQELTYVAELTDLTMAELIRHEGIGPVKAQKVERLLATLGLSLRDGDPDFIEQVRAEEEHAAQVKIEHTPDEIRQSCADALSELGTALVRDGASLLRFTGQVLGRHRRVSGNIRRYCDEHRQARSGEVRRITAEFLVMDDAERARTKARPKKARKTRLQAEQSPANVVQLRAS